jgi:hypothetical protein
MYQLLTVPNKERASRRVLQLIDGRWVVLLNATVPLPSDILPDMIERDFTSFDKFCSQNRQTILAYHDMFFAEPPPKKQDIMATSLMCWAHLVKECRPVLPQVDSSGNKERQSTLGSRKYYVLPTPCDPVTHPAQAVVCLRILADAITASGRDHVTEDELKAAVVNRQAEIKTRQDPWRIFQYYRPTLIARKHVRCL